MEQSADSQTSRPAETAKVKVTGCENGFPRFLQLEHM